MNQPADPPSAEGERRHSKRVDLTVNIPTMLTMAAMIVTTSAWGVGIYANLDKRQMMTEVAISTLSQRIDRVESNVNNVKLDQTAASKTLREEMKTEMGEIKAMLNQIIFSSPTVSQRQLKEWSKN